MRIPAAARRILPTIKASRWLSSSVAPAALLTASLLLAGCQGLGMGGLTGLTGSIGRDEVPPSSQAELERYTDDLGQRYEANPDDKHIALSYARALRAMTRYAQAVAVTQRLAAKYP